MSADKYSSILYSDVCQRTLSVPRTEQFPRAQLEENCELLGTRSKYPSIFSRQMKAIVFIILQIFFATSAVFKNGEYHLDIPQF